MPKSPKSSRQNQRLNKSPPAPPPSSPTTPKRRCWFRATSWAIGTLVATIGLIASIDAIWGPAWPTAPEIHPSDAIDPHSFRIPLTVKNASIVFGINDAEFRCGIDLIYFRDADNKTVLATDLAAVTGTFTVLQNSTIKYDCNGSQIISVAPNGALVFSFGGNSMHTPDGFLKPPLTILKMCIWVSVDHAIYGINQPFKSKMFQWPLASDIPQWVEDPIIGPAKATTKPIYASAVYGLRQLVENGPAPRALLPNALDCSAAPKDAYILFK